MQELQKKVCSQFLFHKQVLAQEIKLGVIQLISFEVTHIPILEFVVLKQFQILNLYLDDYSE